MHHHHDKKSLKMVSAPSKSQLSASNDYHQKTKIPHRLNMLKICKVSMSMNLIHSVHFTVSTSIKSLRHFLRGAFHFPVDNLLNFLSNL